MPHRKPEEEEVVEELGLIVPGEVEEAVLQDLQRLPAEVQEYAALISQKQLELLWAPTPPHAIKERPGPKGKMMSYVSHGYVEFKLNESFGGDWDFTPVVGAFGSHGSYDMVQGEVKDDLGRLRTVNYVVVLGELVVRVRSRKTLKVVTTITKREFGSGVWYPENEIGDALKAALSDALKRCGLRLGIALDLYYDDDRARKSMEDFQRRSKLRKAEAEAERKAKPPQDANEVILRVKEEYGLTGVELMKKLYQLPFMEGHAKLEADLQSLTPETVWFTIQKLFTPPEPPPVSNGQGD